jgi:methyltransferase-like protein
MSEGSNTNVSTEVYIDHSKELIKDAIEGRKLSAYPKELVTANKTRAFKHALKKILQDFDNEVESTLSTEPAVLAWERVKKSENLIELRSSLEMYASIIQHFYENDIQWYADVLDCKKMELRHVKDMSEIASTGTLYFSLGLPEEISDLNTI